MEKRELLRNIPRVDDIIDLTFKTYNDNEEIKSCIGALSLENIRTHVREVIDTLRQDILADKVTELPSKQALQGNRCPCRCHRVRNRARYFCLHTSLPCQE